MALSRRAFLAPPRTARPAGLVSIVGARGREAFEAGDAAAFSDPAEPGSPPIRLASNENPLGPGRAAIDALVGEFPQANRYPFNSRRADRDLQALLAGGARVAPDQVVLGAGSGELLRNASRAFTSKSAGLVTAAPTFATCERMCETLDHPVKAVPLDAALRLDVEAMADAARGAGLVFFCNPNNPSGTVHGAAVVRDFVARVKRTSPDTAILIDEAYHDYVTDPAYASATPLALEYPGVFITRTFSKAYGMAGLRLGYAIGRRDTIEALARFRLPFNANVLAVAAAMASLQDPGHIARERARNTAVRDLTNAFFARAGYAPADSQTNFVFVNIGRPAGGFRSDCAARGVLVGRDFPPLHATHARVSLGTMDEMTRALAVFEQVLEAPASSAARR